MSSCEFAFYIYICWVNATIGNGDEMIEVYAVDTNIEWVTNDLPNNSSPYLNSWILKAVSSSASSAGKWAIVQGTNG